MRPQRDDVIALLSDLVSINSVNPSLVPGAAGEAQIAGYVAGWLRRAGLITEVQEVAPGRPNVIGRLLGSAGGRCLMLNAHLDTVGVAGMERPFDARLEGDRLYGRGAYDMKGSLAAIMLAARRLREAGDFQGELIVTAVADEEYASQGSEAIVATMTADAAIVTEPTGLRLCTAHKGFAWISIETTGRAAHGSRPDLGIDAIVHMGRVLADLEELAQSLRASHPHPLLGTGSLHASLIEGGQELSSYPELCRLHVERRTIPGETPASVLGEFESRLSRRSRDDSTFSARAEPLFWRDSFEVASDAEIVRTVKTAAARVLPAAPELYGDTPWMDAALLSAAGIPTVVFGPGGGGAHAVDEYARLDDVADCAEILALAAREYCRSRP